MSVARRDPGGRVELLGRHQQARRAQAEPGACVGLSWSSSRWPSGRPVGSIEQDALQVEHEPGQARPRRRGLPADSGSRPAGRGGRSRPGPSSGRSASRAGRPERGIPASSRGRPSLVRRDVISTTKSGQIGANFSSGPAADCVPAFAGDPGGIGAADGAVGEGEAGRGVEHDSQCRRPRPRSTSRAVSLRCAIPHSDSRRRHDDQFPFAVRSRRRSRVRPAEPPERRRETRRPDVARDHQGDRSPLAGTSPSDAARGDRRSYRDLLRPLRPPVLARGRGRSPCRGR